MVSPCDVLLCLVGCGLWSYGHLAASSGRFTDGSIMTYCLFFVKTLLSLFFSYVIFPV